MQMRYFVLIVNDKYHTHPPPPSTIDNQFVRMKINFMKKINYVLLAILLVGFASCTQPTAKTESAADTIYFGGDILTMEGNEAQYVEAVAVKNGKIILAGTKAEADKLKGANTQMNDLKGKTLLPGFIDGHSHILTVADATVQANLSPAPVGKVASIPDIISALKELKQQQNFNDTDLLVGWGYDQDFLQEKRHPTAAELDKEFSTNPVILMHTSSHMLVANTKAFQLMGISAATTDPVGGTFIRKKGSKELEGLVQEMAMAPFTPLTKRSLSDEQEF